MPECDYCGETFEDEESHLRHLQDDHEGELSRVDQRRVDDLEEERNINVGVAVLGVVILGSLVLVGYIAVTAGGGGDGEPYGQTHEHGTLAVVIEGEPLDLSQSEFTGQSNDFHFHPGETEAVGNSSRYIWHAHSNGVSVQFALETLGIEVSDDGSDLTYNGITYSENDGASVEILVNGEPVDPDYEVGGGTVPEAAQGDGDDIRVVVESG